jgi:hypothetical protein
VNGDNLEADVRELVVELRNLATKVDHNNATIKSLLLKHDVEIYGDGDQRGLRGRTLLLEEAHANRKWWERGLAAAILAPLVDLMFRWFR